MTGNVEMRVKESGSKRQVNKARRKELLNDKVNY